MLRLDTNTVISTVSAAVLFTALAGCSQGERVFTRQNQAASALATMGMEAEASNALNLDLIYAAEEQLFNACAPLRDVASRRMSGEDVGLDSQLVAFVSMTRCESETKRAETFIQTGDPNVAGFYLQSVSTRELRK